VTLVWLSPGLPADRTELAASLPSDLALFSLPSLDDPAALDALAVGSLCVATVFETELLTQLAHRPAGVRLLVVGPPDRPSQLPPLPGGRAPDAMSPAASLSELATAIAGAAALEPTVATVSTVAMLTPAVPSADRSRLRTRLVAAGAVLAGLAIGGIVIGTTEGSSAASANRTPIGNGNFGGGGNLPGGGNAQGGVPGGAPGGNFGGPGGRQGTGNGTARGATGQELLTCLRQQGFTGTANQLRQQATDPQLRQAFETCLQQLRNSSSQLSGRP
jgi:hypothetical protein